jgi:glycosyltransferase XagB
VSWVGGRIVAYEYGNEAAAARFERRIWTAGDDLTAPISSPRIRRHVEARPPPGACPEIDCIRDLLPAGLIAWAERRAAKVGLGADHVLITADAITEDAYLTALASSLGVRYEWLDKISRDACPLDDEQLIQAAAAGLLPLREGNDIVWIVAPRCLTARRLADPRIRRPVWLRRFRLTSSERLLRFVATHAQNALGRRAAEGLQRARPLLSNAPYALRRPKFVALAFAAFAAALLAAFPTATITAFSAMLCIVFLASAALRVSSALIGRDPPTDVARVSDDRLPIYTIICALYREAPVVEDLVAYIRALDYPGIMAQTPQALNPSCT